MTNKNKCRFDKRMARVFATDVLYDIIGSILYAIGVYTFAAKANFAPGGITGVALIVNHYLPWAPIGVCSLLFNIPVALICYKMLGKRFFFKSVKSMLISAFFLDVVMPFVHSSLIPQYADNRLLAALFAGVLSGAGLAMIYMRGSSTGGTDFIIMSIRKKYPHLSIGTVSLAVDGIVIVAGGFVFKDVNAVLYGVLMTIASTTIIDKLMYGSGSQRMILVISDYSEDIARRISYEAERGVTLLKAIGAYTGKERMVAMCVCSKTEITQLRTIVHNVDKDAMVMLCTVDEAYGLGFGKLGEN